ncbi:hypothetical protein [Amantichitinum ursilacus]|uniref:Uncharacterized protein n=1 Tax=Amantichitinum ursilacus TaxID=857265 RepID=A0A0N1JSN4_9NEIS|nr:hypothetical protein [Amantichitinum ursilacus]KPC52591.1 hypothetical protein WG78_12125 [Amantichitinum ursilacus]
MLEMINLGRPQLEYILKSVRQRQATISPDESDQRAELREYAALLTALGGIAGKEFVLLCVDAVDGPALDEIVTRYRKTEPMVRGHARSFVPFIYGREFVPPAG